MKYICEQCKRTYDTVEGALKCEDFHKKGCSTYSIKLVVSSNGKKCEFLENKVHTDKILYNVENDFLSRKIQKINEDAPVPRAYANTWEIFCWDEAEEIIKAKTILIETAEKYYQNKIDNLRGIKNEIDAEQKQNKEQENED